MKADEHRKRWYALQIDTKGLFDLIHGMLADLHWQETVLGCLRTVDRVHAEEDAKRLLESEWEVFDAPDGVRSIRRRRP